MKEFIIKTLNVLAYVMLLAGVVLTFKGLYELNSTYTYHADPAPFFAVGVPLIISFPFTMGFRYIVEAAIKYITKKQEQ